MAGQARAELHGNEKIFGKSLYCLLLDGFNVFLVRQECLFNCFRCFDYFL